MIILEELFSTVAEFRKYSPYLESNVSFQDLNSSALSAKKQISIILSKEVYDEVAGKAGEPKEALCSAMANLTLAKQMIFDVISRRKTKSTYINMSRKLCDGHIQITISMQWIRLYSCCPQKEMYLKSGKRPVTARCYRL